MGYNVRCREKENTVLLDKGYFTGGELKNLINYMYYTMLLSQDSTRFKLMKENNKNMK